MTDTPDHATLIGYAVDLINALLDDTDTDTVGVANFWDRARTAIETGAASGTEFSETVSTAARKLQITWSFSPGTSATVARLAGDLADPAAFAAWRELCQRDAVYLTAIAKVARAERRKPKPPKPTETSTTQETLL